MKNSSMEGDRRAFDVAVFEEALQVKGVGVRRRGQPGFDPSLFTALWFVLLRPVYV